MPTSANFSLDNAARPADAERFLALPMPTEEEEVWRYSRIAEFDLDRYTPGSGYEVTVEIDDDVARNGVTCGPSDLPQPDIDDVFVTMNAAYASQPLVLDIPAGVVAAEPVRVRHHISAEGAAASPRLVVQAGEQSQVTVVEEYTSADVNALVVPVTEIYAAQAANVRYVGVQELGPRVWQFGYATSRVDRDAFLETAAIAMGGEYARLRTDARVTGQGATSNLLAVYFGTESQLHDFRTMQDHVAPRTTSDLLFKGAVGGVARSVYTGLIRVRPGAHGTNAFQTNRNLILAEGAHAESVPNLEIEENDVRCSHASTIGAVDEDQRYYLESRGIPTAVAERLIVLGFFDEVIERVTVESLRTHLRAAVVAKLDRAIA